MFENLSVPECFKQCPEKQTTVYGGNASLRGAVTSQEKRFIEEKRCKFLFSPHVTTEMTDKAGAGAFL